MSLLSEYGRSLVGNATNLFFFSIERISVPRKFDNQDLLLPNGEVARIGTYMGPNGELSIKLRLPSNYWNMTGMFRAAAGTGYKNGKTVVTFDKE